MAVLATLEDVKAVTRGSPDVQALHVSDIAVINAFAFADKLITAERYGTQEKEAQIYFVAHILSLATTNAGGQGPISSESIGGVTQSFTLPYLNRKTVLASTQYGLMFIEIRENVTPPAMVIKIS